MHSRSNRCALLFAASLLSPLALADMSGWTRAQLQALTTMQILALGGADIGSLSAAQTAWLSPSQAHALMTARLSLSPADPTTLTPAELRVASPYTVSWVASVLNTTGSYVLFDGQVAAMTEADAAALNPAHIRNLTPAQIPMLPPAAIPFISANYFTFDQVRLMSPAQLRRLSLTNVEDSDGFPIDNGIEGLVPSTGYFSPDQLKALPGNVLYPVTPSSFLGYTPTSEFPTKAQFAALYAGPLVALFQYGFPPDTSWFTAAQLASKRFPLDQLRLPVFKQLTLAQLTSMAPETLGRMRADQAALLSAAQIAALSPAQLTATLTTSDPAIPSGIYTWTAAQIAALSAAQVAALPGSLLIALTPVQFAALGTAKIAALSPEQLVAFAPPASWQIPPAVLAAYSPARFNALGRDVWSADFFTAAQVTAVTPAQIAGMAHPERIATLTSQVQFMTAAQVAAITIEQIRVVSPASFSRMNNAQLKALKVSQLYAMRPDQINGFSPVQLGNLSADQLGAINIAVAAGGGSASNPTATNGAITIGQNGVTLYRGWNFLPIVNVIDGAVVYANEGRPIVPGYDVYASFKVFVSNRADVRLVSYDGVTLHFETWTDAEPSVGPTIATLGDGGNIVTIGSASTTWVGSSLSLDAAGYVRTNGHLTGRLVYDKNGIIKTYAMQGATFTPEGGAPVAVPTTSGWTTVLDDPHAPWNTARLEHYVTVDRDGNVSFGEPVIDNDVNRMRSPAFNLRDRPVSFATSFKTNGGYSFDGRYEVDAEGVLMFIPSANSGNSGYTRRLGKFTIPVATSVATTGEKPVPDLSAFAPLSKSGWVYSSWEGFWITTYYWTVNGVEIYAAGTGARLTVQQIGSPKVVPYTDPATGAVTNRYGWVINGQTILDPANGAGGYTGGTGTGGSGGGGPGGGTGGGDIPTAPGGGNPGTGGDGGGGGPILLDPGTFGGGAYFDYCLNTWVATQSCDTGDCGGGTTAYGTTREEAIANLDDAVCIPSTSELSVVDNYTFNHIHSALDYIAPKASSAPGCASCGGGSTPGVADRDPRAGVARIHRSRDCFLPSSFGVGVYLAYDISLTIFESGGSTYIDCFNPAWMGARRYSPSGTVFKDTVYNSCQAFRLYDAAGNLTLSRANAVRGTLVHRDGGTLEFDLFAQDDNTASGRPTVFRAIDGAPYLTLTYPVAAAASASADAKRRLGAVTDRYGNTVSFTYATLDSGRQAIVEAALPGGRQLRYAYDSAGNLVRVDMPGGDVSTFTFGMGGNGVFSQTFRDAGATGTHRNKTAYYTNTIAMRLLGETSRPAFYNQSSMLVYAGKNADNETAFYGISHPGSSIHRKVYTGGGRLRFVDVANDTRFKTWSLASGSGSLYDKFSGVQEAFGHVAPYLNYAQNRQRISPVVTTPEGLVHNFTYDANGNYTAHQVGTKTDRHAADARFNRPILDVDYTGRARVRAYDPAGNLVSDKTGWTMDASVPAGTTVPGVRAAFYSTPPLTFGPYTGNADLAPVSVTGMPGIASSYNDMPGLNSAIYDGDLTVAQAGVRTFKLSSGYYGTRLVIDGQTVLTAYYTQSSVSADVNLTAGVHTIRVYTAGAASVGFSLTWAGPETLVNGVAQQQPIAQEYLSHKTVAGETAVRPTAAAGTTTYTYYPTGDALAGLLRTSVDPAGKTTRYTYDTNRRLVTVETTGDTGALVTVRTQTYDARGNLASSSDALGRTLTYGYDERDRLVKTVYGDGTTETTTYGTGEFAGLVLRRKDRIGAVTKTDYDATGRPVRVIAGYALADNDGHFVEILPESAWSVTTHRYLAGTSDAVRSVTDGKITEYEYDYKGRVVATCVYPSSGRALITRTAYGPDEQRFSETDPYGRRTFFAYRSEDKMLVREVRELIAGSLGTPADNAAVLALSRDPAPNPAYTVTDYTLDAQGRTTATTGPRGIDTTYAYDAAGRQVSQTLAAGRPEAQTTLTAYDAAGKVVAVTDPIGRVTATAYTPAGRVGTVTTPDGKTHVYTYYADGRTATTTDAKGNVSNFFYSQCCGRDAGSADALDQGTLKFYDGEGHATYVATVKDLSTLVGTGPDLPAAAVVSAVSSKYDAQGRVVATTRWLTIPTSVDPKHPPIATDPAQGLTTTYAYYDDLNDARFAPVLANLAAKGVHLSAGSATVTTSPTGEASFAVQDGAGRTVASGVFNKAE